MNTNDSRIRQPQRDPPPVDPSGDFVLYWMRAVRRMSWNFALDRAIDWARDLGAPLLVLETLPIGERWASDRHHAFVLAGMADNAADCQRLGVGYYPFVETAPGEAIELLEALAGRSCLMVTDEFPTLEFRCELATALERVSAKVELVDSCGLLPLAASDKTFARAFDFRRHLQKTLPDHLMDQPRAKPRVGKKPRATPELPKKITRRWPAAAVARGKDGLAESLAGLAKLPIDHDVSPGEITGGSAAAERRLAAFLKHQLADYADNRNHPDLDATSNLSPYLHFGHISAHQIFHDLANMETWSPDRLSQKVTGAREGWWGMSPSAEAFLDELVTWREVGYNRCAMSDDYDQYASLPDWARETLRRHAGDRREYVYSLQQFEQAATHDPLWNAAQTQLVTQGRLHNYLRMLWGKKILEWTAKPEDALAVMIELNNKYGLDGLDPNSYSGILWTLGRYDRAWGPERPIFGKIRYMSSDNTLKKVRVREYLERYGAQPCKR